MPMKTTGSFKNHITLNIGTDLRIYSLNIEVISKARFSGKFIRVCYNVHHYDYMLKPIFYIHWQKRFCHFNRRQKSSAAVVRGLICNVVMRVPPVTRYLVYKLLLNIYK